MLQAAKRICTAVTLSTLLAGCGGLSSYVSNAGPNRTEVEAVASSTESDALNREAAPLQLVDVTRGPLLRVLGLATLKFVTASATTGVNLPGLPEAEAEALRDRLVELAETRRSGL